MKSATDELGQTAEGPFWQPLEGWLVLEGVEGGASYAAAHFWDASADEWACINAGHLGHHMGPLLQRHPWSPNIRQWRVWPDVGVVPLCETCKTAIISPLPHPAWAVELVREANRGAASLELALDIDAPKPLTDKRIDSMLAAHGFSQTATLATKRKRGSVKGKRKGARP